MPKTPGPDELPAGKGRFAKAPPDLPEEMRKWLQRPRPIEIRPVEPLDYSKPEKRPPHQRVWIRADGKLPDDLMLHQCVVAYASDMTLLDTAILPHAITFLDSRFQVASLDHAMWFHRPFRADEWLLYAQESPSASGARGFTQGRLFTQDGILAVSVVQEGLIRMRISGAGTR
jgi:acyl-CoA thioesterase-2